MFETDTYTAPTYDYNGTPNTPWWDHHLDVRKVTVVDKGVQPKSIGFWFQAFRNCKYFEVRQIDMSKCPNMMHAFWSTGAIEVDLSDMNVSHIENMDAMFGGSTSLEEVSFAGWSGTPSSAGYIFYECTKLKKLDFGNIYRFTGQQMNWTFYNCRSLVFDCSNWDVSNIKSHTDFAHNAPGVIEPKWSD